MIDLYGMVDLVSVVRTYMKITMYIDQQIKRDRPINQSTR